MEIWKELKVKGGTIKVSDLGKVFIPAHELVYVNHKGVKFVKHIDACYPRALDNGRGYKYIPAFGKKYYIHRLVAMAFIPNPENKPEIDHINTNRADNRLCNLRWVTRKENCNNEITNKRNRLKCGVPIIQLDINGKYIDIHPSFEIAAERLGVASSSIKSIIYKEGSKSCKGYTFVLANEYDPNKDYSVRYKRGTFPTYSNAIQERMVIIVRNGKIDNVYQNAEIACKDYGVSASAIRTKMMRNNHAPKKGVFKNVEVYYLKNIPEIYRQDAIDMYKLKYA